VSVASTSRLPGGKLSPRMSDLDHEIAFYETLRPELETHQLGKWVLVHGCKLEGTYDSFEAAAAGAVERFGGGPFLIRQVGAPPITLPASVMYNVSHG
jgi:hypothetical protein